MDGAEVIAKALKDQGVEFMFGIVGRPVTTIAMMAQGLGIKYISCRNEQAASYAAGAVGYLTGRPGACLVVSGPGVIHGLAGVANSWANCWPMILLGGANPTKGNDTGDFQEAPQIESVRPYVKLAARAESVSSIPFLIEKAVRTSIYGRPGAVYIDLPAQVIYDSADFNSIVFPERCADAPVTLADQPSIEDAIQLLLSAKKPLVVVGKGAAYAKAENSIRQFVEASGYPVLPTPMGKGIVDDSSPACISAARSLAIKEADVVLLIGARLNWMLHFGLPPRWSPTVKFIQVDIHAEEMSNNKRSVPLVGNANAVVLQLLDELNKHSSRVGAQQNVISGWWKVLNEKVDRNKQINQHLYADDSVPMSYYRAIKGVEETLPDDVVIVSEGANTMDIGRTILDHPVPRHRLDAGTWGTMGVGLGFAMAASLVYPGKKIVALEGDSAFGFSGMEIETMCRYKMDIIVVIINNNGISRGLDSLTEFADNPPFFAYTPSARYEKIAEAFGGKGFMVTKPSEIEPAMDMALKANTTSIVNLCIDPAAQRKPQEFPFELNPTKASL